MFYLFHVFRSFIPLSNPIGFGASDFVELLIAFTLLLLVLARDPILRLARSLARKTASSMLALGGLTVALRLALLPRAGAPISSTADDNSYLLLADTLSHFRLANPTHPFYRFFEANFVLQQPSYSSIFPMGQGIALALGRAIFGHPWAGVMLTEAALCALCYWMLRGWVSAGWALLGGLFAVFELGPLTYWMNSYWGGAVSGIAGCLVFGSLPRLRNQSKLRDAILLGAGLGLELLTRPYECVLLAAIVALYFGLNWGLNWRNFLRVAPLAIAAALPFITLTLAQNKAVTGSWTTLPYMTSREQYGVPTTFTFQPDPKPHRELTAEQKQDYQVQSEAHAQESARSFGDRFLERAGLVRFFVFPAFLAALPGLLISFKRKRMILPAVAVVLFLGGAAFYPYFYPHYIAALACVFLLLIVAALERIPRAAAFAICGVAALHFVFWYGVHLSGHQGFLAGLVPFETFDFVNHGDPEGRLPILKQLQEAAGGQLVFVHYAPFRPLREWISNAADIDRAKVVWALDLGREENRELAAYYPDRKVWLAEPDARPPRLRPYSGF